MNIGIIGHRSWIAKHLETEVLKHTGWSSTKLDKRAAVIHDLSGYDCVYLFSGRARPSEDEKDAEISLLNSIASIPPERFPKLMIYLGSEAVNEAPDERTDYGIHKSMCETIITRSKCDRMCIIRAPAVFGLGQPSTSPMLIPQLGVFGDRLHLRSPDKPTSFIHVKELVKLLVKAVEFHVEGHDASFFTLGDLLGHNPAFTITPRQLQALRSIWKWYDSDEYEQN